MNAAVFITNFRIRSLLSLTAAVCVRLIFLPPVAASSLCGGCHEIIPSIQLWESSTHRHMDCGACHGSLLSLNLGQHWESLSKTAAHFLEKTPRIPRLRDARVDDLLERCQGCHQQEFSLWRSSGHSASYAEIFLNRDHNSATRLQDDCLRCHGMFFEGSIDKLVAPVDTNGPWNLVPDNFDSRPAIPCLACHQIHTRGEPAVPHSNAAASLADASHALSCASLAFYDHREKLHIAVANLPLPEVMDGDAQVRISPDLRQGLCYQCHAPDLSRQAGSADDRTPLGVHEGLSCLACHATHSMETRRSCAECHPRLSNCGLDVESMDTTFRNPQSAHNIHFVKCQDCHPGGIPEKKKDAATE